MTDTADHSDAADALLTLDDVRERRCRSERVWHRLRRSVMTSTEVAALFEASPWLTPFALWHQKAGNVESGKPATAAMRLGLELEAAARRMWEHEAGGRVRPAGMTFRWSPSARLGASFDGFAVAPDGAAGLVECKAIARRRWDEQWRLAHGSVEPPSHYRLQAETQLALTGAVWLDFAVVVFGHDGQAFEVVRIEPHADLRRSIVERVEAFWASLAADASPPPDYRKALPSLRELFPPRDVAWESTSDDELARMTAAAKRAAAADTARRLAQDDGDAARAEVLHLLRGCDVAELGGVRLTYRPDKCSGPRF